MGSGGLQLEDKEGTPARLRMVLGGGERFASPLRVFLEGKCNTFNSFLV